MRETVTMGDPGIDARWVRRRALGMAMASAWMMLATLAVGVMAAAAIGPVGWIEGWQSREYGFSNPILAALPFMFLPFSPWLVKLLPVDARRPVLLEMQQAISTTVGPRFVPTDDMKARLAARTIVGTTVASAVGAAALVGGAVWTWSAAHAPLAPPVRVSYDDVVHGRAPSGRVVVTGAEQRSQGWLQVTQARGHALRDYWRVLLPPGGYGQEALVEKIVVGADENGRLHPYVRPTLSGKVGRLDDWTADRLREQGFTLTDHPFVLERSMGDEGDSMDAAGARPLLALFGFVTLFMGLVVRWKTRRMAR